MGSVSSLAQGQEKRLFSDTADKPAQSPEKGLLSDTADKPAQSPEKRLLSDTADAEESSPVSKKAKTEQEVVYVSPLKEEELEPLKSSLWFHDKQGGGETQGQGSGETQGQGSGETQGQEPWITRSASETRSSPSLSSHHPSSNLDSHELCCSQTAVNL